MGLDTTHNAWHGPYSAFYFFRREIAKALELPPLELMEGFYFAGQVTSDPFYMVKKDAMLMSLIGNTLTAITDQFPIKWAALKPNAVYELLYHSDCDGDIAWENCKAIAESLQSIQNKFEDDGTGYSTHARIGKFILGLRDAYDKKENLEFH